MIDMPLADWIEAEKLLLDEFAKWWLSEQSDEAPDKFPIAMQDGEWDEQYRCWGRGQ